MKKRLLSLAMAVMMLVTIAFACMPSAAAAEDPREGVALVYVCFEVDNVGQIGGASLGSCFFVGDPGSDAQFCITNHHVIEEMYLELGGGEMLNIPGELIGADGRSFTGRAKIRVYFDANDYLEASCVDYDAKKDLALLKLEKPTSKRHPLKLRMPTDDLVGTATVRAVGFPGLSDNEYASPTSRWGLSDISVTSGHISRILTTSGSGVEHLQLDLEIKHGNSGGPLVDDNGNVLGVTTWGTPEGMTEELKYAVSVTEVKTLLDRNGAHYVTADEGGLDLTMILIIAGAALGVVLIILIIVLIAKKNKKASQAQIAQAQEQAKIAQEQAAQAQAEAQAAANAAPLLTPTVRSLAIQHRGLSVPLTTGKIMVGRNQADCALCYAASTPGVSGRHCSVAFDVNTGDFILTDLKSTYGTFLQNGQKLTPLVQYRLRSGDRFYVGETGNMIVVELR